MKKFFKTLLVLLLVLMPVTFASAKKSTTTTTTAATSSDRITMYVFYGDGCPHCEELETYIATTLKKDSRVKDFLDVVYYETWYDTTNSGLAQLVGSELKTEVKGVPFVVIGDQYFSGYAESMNEEVVSKILSAKNSDRYVDVVAKVAKDSNVTPNASNPEAGKDANSNEKDESKKNDVIGIVILGITVVIILAIIFTKHSDEDEESEGDEDEDVEEETDDEESEVESDEDEDEDDTEEDEDSEEDSDDEEESEDEESEEAEEEETEEKVETVKPSKNKKSSKKKKNRR